MERKIKITADSTCDLSPELCEEFGVELIPLHIVYNSESYDDGVNIFPSDIMNRYAETKQLPKTSAVTSWEYAQVFKKYIDSGYEIIHISLGSSISSTHQNSVIAANDLGGVYPVDSQSLGFGSGILACIAHDMIRDTELSAGEIAEELKDLIPHISASFVIDNLEFLRAGGRCSTLAMLGANLLNIKPCIEVSNSNGASMTVGRKYRGKFDKIIAEYVREKLSQFSSFDTRRICIEYTDVPQEIVDLVYDIINEADIFENIYITRASCTITSHCGAGTLGIFFMAK